MKFISILILTFFITGTATVSGAEKVYKTPKVSDINPGSKAIIVGHIKGLKDSKLTLSPYYKPTEKHVVDVKGGKFRYEIEVSEPSRFVLANADYSFKVDFFLEHGKLTLTGELGRGHKIKGGPSQKAYAAWQKKISTYDLRILELDRAFKLAKKNNDSAELAKIDQALKEVANEKKMVSVNYVEQHSNSYVSLDLMTPLVRQRYPSFAGLKALFEGLDQELQQSDLGTNIQKGINALSPSFVPYVAQEFAVMDVDSVLVRLSDYKGKYVLVDFWASWCGPCRAENPHVVKAYTHYHPKGLEILGVSLDTKRDAWIQAIADDGLPWRQVSNLRGWKDEIAKQYEVNGIPDNFLIDPNGNVVARGLRGKALGEKFSEIFK